MAAQLCHVYFEVQNTFSVSEFITAVLLKNIKVNICLLVSIESSHGPLMVSLVDRRNYSSGNWTVHFKPGGSFGKGREGMGRRLEEITLFQFEKSKICIAFEVS